MAKSEIRKYVAVMSGEDGGEVDALKAVVSRAKGSVSTTEEKVVKGKTFTGVGIHATEKQASVITKLMDECWTLHDKGVVTESEKPQKVKVKPEPKVKPVEQDDDDEGYDTGDAELDAYLNNAERRGCSYGEISLMIPSKAKPSAAFVNSGGYLSFHRGNCRCDNPRLPSEVQS